MSRVSRSVKPPITYQTFQRAQLAQEAKGTKTLLVIEPHPAVAEVLVTTLHLFQYRCCLLSNLDGATFLYWHDRIERPPEGILLDVDIHSRALHHPFEVVQTFYREWQHTFFAVPMPPLLLLTTHPREGEELREAGHRVVMKPFRPSALMSLIASAIDQTQ